MSCNIIPHIAIALDRRNLELAMQLDRKLLN